MSKKLPPGVQAANRKVYRREHRAEISAYGVQYRMTHKLVRTPAAKLRMAERYQALSPEQKMYDGAKVRAKRDEVPFNITPEDIKIPTHCPVLGMLLSPGRGRPGHKPQSPSLDRIIPSLGYVVGNVAVISARANLIKNDGSAEEHRRIAMYVDTRGNMLEPQVI